MSSFGQGITEHKSENQLRAYIIWEEVKPLHHGPSGEVFGKHPVNSQFNDLWSKK